MNDRLHTEPHASGCEIALLGAAMEHPPTAANVLGDLVEADFTDPRHRVILRVLRSMLDQGIAPEPCLVVAELWRHNDVRPPTGRSWALILADMIRHAALPGSTATHRRALLEARLRREAMAYATRVHEAARTGSTRDLWTALETSTTELGLTLARISETSTPTTVPTRIHRAA